MRIRFWGVRGSIASPGKNTSEYGGNTSCVEVEDDDGQVFIFDAGTGIRELGLDLVKRKVKVIHLFISHTHWDHIQGFPFFVPAYLAGNKIHIYGPIHFEKPLKKIMDLQMDYAYFPVSMEQLNAEIDYTNLKEESIQIGNTQVVTKYSNHPVTGLCYKVICNGKSVVYTGDTEPYYNVLKAGAKTPAPDHDHGAESSESRESVESVESDDDFGGSENDEDMDKIVAERNEHHRNFCVSDVLIHDAQYTAEEYPKYLGWGHSPMEQVIAMAKISGNKKLILTHHDPGKSDSILGEIEKRLRGANPGMDLSFSKEGMEIPL